MILVDSSVIIDYLRHKDPRLRSLFYAHQAAICGVTQAEVLQGARDAKHFKKLEKILAGFPSVAIPERTWDSLGHNLFLLRINGVTVPFADTILATLAMDNSIELWTGDAQFNLIQGVLPALQLFKEPP